MSAPPFRKEDDGPSSRVLATHRMRACEGRFANDRKFSLFALHYSLFSISFSQFVISSLKKLRGWSAAALQRRTNATAQLQPALPETRRHQVLAASDLSPSPTGFPRSGRSAGRAYRPKRPEGFRRKRVRSKPMTRANGRGGRRAWSRQFISMIAEITLDCLLIFLYSLKYGNIRRRRGFGSPRPG
jgi:hypothetical protein